MDEVKIEDLERCFKVLRIMANKEDMPLEKFIYHALGYIQSNLDDALETDFEEWKTVITLF